jgi:hypothetical protein
VTPAVTPYDALVGLAERELELAAAGALDDLPALRAERSALVAGLPAVPPADARPALERAWQLQRMVSAVLEERLREAGGELARLGRGRNAMHGYAGNAQPPKLVDRAG